MKKSTEKITYRITNELSTESVTELYRCAGWIPETAGEPAYVGPMLRNTHAVSAAFSGDRLIGMMRALSDGVSDAYMLDLVVAPEFRRNGVGKKILDHLVKYLTAEGIDWIVCIGAPGTEVFYGKTAGVKMEGYAPMRFYGKGEGENKNDNIQHP